MSYCFRVVFVFGKHGSVVVQFFVVCWTRNLHISLFVLVHKAHNFFCALWCSYDWSPLCFDYGTSCIVRTRCWSVSLLDLPGLFDRRFTKTCWEQLSFGNTILVQVTFLEVRLLCMPSSCICENSFLVVTIKIKYNYCCIKLTKCSFPLSCNCKVFLSMFSCLNCWIGIVLDQV